MKTHEYTNDQIQNAIDAACRLNSTCKLSLCSWTKDWREEKAQRLSIAKAFLVVLSEPTQEERWQAEFEKLFPVKPEQFQDGSYVNYEPSVMWRAFLAAKKGGAK